MRESLRERKIVPCVRWTGAFTHEADGAKHSASGDERHDHRRTQIKLAEQSHMFGIDCGLFE